MKIEIKRDKCISIASCVALAPDTFKLDDEGIAAVKDDHGDTREKIIVAAESCPAKAIYIYEDNGARIYPKDEDDNS